MSPTFKPPNFGKPPKPDNGKPSYGPGPYDVLMPDTQSVPLIFNSPHSGRHYPQRLLRLSRLDAMELRRSEDFFVDLLFDHAPDAGAPFLKATYPRVYIDLNREPYELDPSMFSDKLPPYANTESDRVYSGFGSIPRVVALDQDIYKTRLEFAMEQSRIESIHKPYHRRLKDLVEKTSAVFGWTALIDCHSMPASRSMSMLSLGRFVARDDNERNSNADIVLGDRYGRSCSSDLTDCIEATLRDMGYSVSRNNPYAGGYCTAHYGKPSRGIHAIQIEINRRLYMNEKKQSPRVHDLEKLRDDMKTLVSELARLNLGVTRRQAAE